MALDSNRKVVGLDYISIVRKVCNNEGAKPYVSKPLTDKEIKKIYRNDFFSQDSNAYFPDKVDDKDC